MIAVLTAWSTSHQNAVIMGFEARQELTRGWEFFFRTAPISRAPIDFKAPTDSAVSEGEFCDLSLLAKVAVNCRAFQQARRTSGWQKHNRYPFPLQIPWSARSPLRGVQVPLASMAEKSLTINLYPGRGIKAVRISSDRTAGTES